MANPSAFIQVANSCKAEAVVAAWKLPLCDCSNTSASCLGRQPGKSCMAKDAWYKMPCDEGKCPGLGGVMTGDCCGGRGGCRDSGSPEEDEPAQQPGYQEDAEDGYAY